MTTIKNIDAKLEFKPLGPNAFAPLRTTLISGHDVAVGVKATLDLTLSGGGLVLGVEVDGKPMRYWTTRLTPMLSPLVDEALEQIKKEGS